MRSKRVVACGSHPCLHLSVCKNPIFLCHAKMIFACGWVMSPTWKKTPKKNPNPNPSYRPPPPSSPSPSLSTCATIVVVGGGVAAFCRDRPPQLAHKPVTSPKLTAAPGHVATANRWIQPAGEGRVLQIRAGEGRRRSWLPPVSHQAHTLPVRDDRREREERE